MPNPRQNRPLLFALLLPLLMTTACAQIELPTPPGAALVEDDWLTEMSGLEASPRNPGVFWSINDSGSVARLYRLDAAGRALGRVRLRGPMVYDSETLAVWREVPGERDWLLIGDVGDNHGWRSEVRVHAVAEPALDASEAQIAWTLRFRYPDGPRDVEGIAVDHQNRQLLLLSKRDQPARLYRVALDDTAAGRRDDLRTAELMAVLPDNAVQGRITGLDLSKDGRRLAVLSYQGLYLWERAADAAWPDALRQAPRTLPMPALRKAEAMAFDHAGEAIFVGSELRPTPFVRIAL